MGFVAKKKTRDWRSSDHKHRFAARNDVGTLERSISILRRRNPKVGRVRAFLIKLLGGQVGRVDELREIARLEPLLAERRARLLELEEAVGWDPEDEN